MSDEDMQRTLCAEFLPLSLELDKGELLPSAATRGWTNLGNELFYCQQDIDLSGYAMSRKTFYPYSSFEQRAGFTIGEFSNPLTAQPYVTDVTIVSSVPLNDSDLAVAAVYAPGFTTLFGFTGPFAGVGRFDRSNIIHGEMKLYTQDSTMAVPGGSNTLKLIDRQTFSSLEPTAADKLFCYRLVGIVTATDETIKAVIPASRVLLPGNISSEPQLEYMMRLKRSYELANQV